MTKKTRSGTVASTIHLLDTGTILWALGSPERLSRRARNLVEAGENVLSVVSYWEVVIKTHKGLLTIADVPAWWGRATELLNGRTLPIRTSHVSALATLPMHHKDPFDRMLISQAIAEGLSFVTNDGPIGLYQVRTLW